MKAYRINTEVDENGTVLLHALPFKAGEEVEIIILSREDRTAINPATIQGKVMEYINPTTPVAEDDWEVLQ